MVDFRFGKDVRQEILDTKSQEQRAKACPENRGTKSQGGMSGFRKARSE